MTEENNKPCENGQEPPEIPENLKVEKEWADKLGMEYDLEKAAEAPKPDSFPPSEPDKPSAAPRPQSMYVMPADEPLPRRERQRPMPPTFMLWAILSTICCCLPAGVVAIVFSAQVSSRYYAGDYKGARQASRRAEIWIIASIVCGIIFNAFYLPMSMMMTPAMGM